MHSINICCIRLLLLLHSCFNKAYYVLQVSEILDSELLGEGLIPTLQQAHDMLLVKNPKTVPYRATTYAQVCFLCFVQYGFHLDSF